MQKVALHADRLWIIRSTRTMLNGSKDIRYYESPSVWNRSPLAATIFQEYEAGESHLNMYHRRDAAKKWADGSTELFDLVPMLGEILNSPNGTGIVIK